MDGIVLGPNFELEPNTRRALLRQGTPAANGDRWEREIAKILARRALSMSRP